MTALCNLKTIALIAFLLSCLVSSFADEHKSPSEVINLWTEVYGVEQLMYRITLCLIITTHKEELRGILGVKIGS